MCKSIGVFDHTTRNRSTGDLVLAISEISSKLSSVSFTLIEKQADEDSAADNLKNCDIVVGHFFSQDSWDKLVSTSKQGSVRVRTSTAGRSGQNHTTKDGVVVLQLQSKHNLIKADEWAAILAYLLTPDAALNIVNGSIPAAMAKFFGTGNMELLPALSILCQGYLIVCANQGNGKKELPAYLQRWVSTQSTGLSKRVDITEVQKHCFWNIFGEQATETPIKLTESEWNGLPGDGDITAVKALLQVVVPDKHTPDDKLVASDEKLVAAAFEAIAGKLGTNRGK